VAQPILEVVKESTKLIDHVTHINMPIDYKRKLAFCHIPRTGGVSVVNGLDMMVVDRHYKASWYRKFFPNYTLFTIIRDYSDRIKSAYGWKVPEGYPFTTLEEMVEDRVKKDLANVSLMTLPNHYFLDVEVDYKLRFDYLNEDLNKMLEALGHDKVSLVPCNSFRV
jgi:hypothetical protein